MTDNNAVTQQADAARDARTEAALLPPVDVIEDSGGITLFADLPGVPKDQLNLQVEADTLTIEGVVMLPMAADMEATHTEVSLPRYRRVFTLSRELDTDKVAAEFINGQLKLRIPRAEHAQPRKIEIRVSGQ